MYPNHSVGCTLGGPQSIHNDVYVLRFVNKLKKDRFNIADYDSMVENETPSSSRRRVGHSGGVEVCMYSINASMCIRECQKSSNLELRYAAIHLADLT
jgi:hypothetical protein